MFSTPKSVDDKTGNSFIATLGRETLLGVGLLDKEDEEELQAEEG